MRRRRSYLLLFGGFLLLLFSVKSAFADLSTPVTSPPESSSIAPNHATNETQLSSSSPSTSSLSSQSLLSPSSSSSRSLSYNDNFSSPSSASLSAESALLSSSSNHNDFYEDDNKSANNRRLSTSKEPLNCNSSCASNRQRRNMRFSHKFDRRGYSCFCDENCAEFGDCCSDVLMAQTRPDWHCMETRGTALWVRITCKDGWNGHADIKHKCESPAAAVLDPAVNAPVTSRASNISYKNIFCAVCNDDYDRIYRWTPQLMCEDHLFFDLEGEQTPDDYIRRNLVLSENKKTWGVWHKKQFVTCNLAFQGFTQSDAYNCVPLLDKCDSEFAGTETERMCHSYLAAVNNGSKSFKNMHCAQCQRVTENNLSCGIQQYSFQLVPRQFVFTVLMDINQATGNIVGKVTQCKENEVFDPFYKECRNVICGYPDYVLRNKRCVQVLTENTTMSNATDANKTSQETEPYSRSFLECPKDYLNADQFMLFANRSVYIPKYDVTFAPENYAITTDGRLLFCIFFVNLTNNEISKFSTYMSYVTAVGMGISISFLTLHILVVFIVPDMRNLSGKNLASLSACLLIAYLCFIFGNLSTSAGEKSCQQFAVATYYFFLASFFWMNCMSFDVWRTLRLATTELRVVSGKQWKRFLCYSGYVYLVTAFIVGLTLIFEHTNAVPIEYRPAFGRHSCWFGHRKALMVFFALPLLIVMLVNITLFILSAAMIMKARHSSAKNASAQSRRNYKLYVKLAVMMGLTWSTGIFAGYLDWPVLWYFFIVLNTLQGAFIFVCFSCTKKVGWYFRDKIPGVFRATSTSSSVHSGTAFSSNSTSTSQISRRTSPRSSTNYKHTAAYLAQNNKNSATIDMY